ncbi:MAG: thermonuclease family protein [Geminicoccaceae bacterium]
MALALGFAVLAAEGARAEELSLIDGRATVAAGIVLVGAAAAVGDLTPVDPAGVVLDRHGRVRAQLRAADGSWLQASLVASGQAVVAPADDVATADLGRLLALERTARDQRLGVWADGRHGPWPAERVAARRGAFVLVRGTVSAVARRGRFTYLDFGADWRRDFTLRAENRDLAGFARAGLAVETLAGRRILARGWLFESAGPMIELVHPAQIEVEE